jgi:uroporphyrinogen decarboxylase
MPEKPGKMSARERVLSALQHRQPDRVPFSWGFGPTPEMTHDLEAYLGREGLSWSRLRAATEDVLPVSPRYIGPPLQGGKDIWGIERRPVAYARGHYDEIKVYPLAGLATPGEVSAYPWPDPEAYDYDGLRAQVLATDSEGSRARKLNIDVCGNPLEIYCWMTGLEEALTNMVLRPDLVHAALERITSFFEAKLRRALATCADLVDILYFADDLGSQRSLLISRQTYREVLQPYHRRLMRLAKEMAPRASVMHHSDGAVFEILPDLMDAGVEVLEAAQTDASGMGPEALKRAYGDRLCFYGGISVQSLLPHADEGTVLSECRRLVDAFGRGGGYIAAPTHAIQVGTPPQNILAMLRGVLGEEDYEIALGARHAAIP